MTKVVGYIRVSTDKQVQEGEGLETQRQHIVSFCRDNNYELIHIYSDEGISGADEIEDRPELQEMMDYCNNPPIKHVIVDRPDRLARDFYLQLYIEKQLKINYVTVLYASNEAINIADTDTEMMKTMKTLMRQMMGAFAELDRKMIKKRLYDGQAIKASKGNKPSGKQPFGYKYASDRKSTEIDREQAFVVLDIFEMRAKGKTLVQIAERLNTASYQQRRPAATMKAWNYKTVQHMVNNEYYAGMLSFSGKRYMGNHEAIIGNELWVRVQAVNELNSRKRAVVS